MVNRIKNLIIRILQRGQAFTKSDNVYIAKNGFYLLLGNFISMTTSFLLSLAFARLLPREIYGQYRYILSISTLLAIFSLQGINKAIIQSVANGFEGAVERAFRTKLKWGLIGSLASIVIAIYFWIQNEPELTISLLIIAVFLPLFKSGEIYQSYLDGKKLFGKRISYTNIIQIISSLFLFAGLFLTNNLIIITLIYFASYSILRIICFLWTMKKFKPNKDNDSQTIPYGKHLSLMEVIGTIAGEADNVLLFYFLGPAKLAIYSFATLTIDYARTPLQIIQEVAFPKLATRSVEEIKKHLPQKLIKSTILILVGIAIYFLAAPYFYKIFYPQYMESVFYSRLFSLTLLIFPMSMIALSLCAKSKTKELYKINIFVPIIQLVAMIGLVPFFGILGAILARLISQLFYLFIAVFFLKKM